MVWKQDIKKNTHRKNLTKICVPLLPTFLGFLFVASCSHEAATVRGRMPPPRLSHGPCKGIHLESVPARGIGLVAREGVGLELWCKEMSGPRGAVLIEH